VYRGSRAGDIDILTAALRAKQCEEVTGLTSELRAMRETTMTCSVSVTIDLMTSMSIKLRQQQRENDDVRTKFDEEHQAKQKGEGKIGEQGREIECLRRQLEEAKR
jgi:hypothetical protein